MSWSQYLQEPKFGKVFMVGKNSHGQLGCEIKGKDIIYDQENFTSTLLPLDGFDKISLISCGPSHSGFIHDGDVYMFGDGSFGKLGNGTTEDKKKPTLVISAEKFEQLISANEHSIALTNRGSVYSWGSTSYGRLGVGEKPYKVRVSPILVDYFMTNNIIVSKIYACGAASAALSDKGILYTWGINKNGQLGHGNNVDYFYPTQVNFFKSNRILTVSMGNRQMGCIDSQNNIYMWGLNDCYQLGDGTSFSKNIPQLIRVKNIKFTNLICGGDFTAAISDAEDNNSLYVWGGFVREYSSSKPKKLYENVESASCSIDCGKHLIFTTLQGTTHSVGWSRYGQTTYEMDTLMVENSQLETVVGRVSGHDCGAYHSALLVRNPSDLIMILLKLGLNEHTIKYYSLFKDVLTYVNPNGDNLLHMISQSRQDFNILFNNTAPLINNPNKLGYPPFFYNSKLLTWFPNYKPNVYYQTPQTGDTLLHYYVNNNMMTDLEYSLSLKGLVNCNLRNKANKRALELIEDQEVAYSYKTKYNIYDVGIVCDPSSKHVVDVIVKSLGTNNINACVITNFAKDKNCIGYVFCINSTTLKSVSFKDYLLNFVSKQPMISIWVEKSNIDDPTLESCIYRSQLVDFSSESLYSNSLSVLLQGAHNMIDFIPGQDNDQEQEGVKADGDFITSRSEKESIFISCDTSKIKQFQPLFDFLKDNGIEIISRDKGVLQSWLVIAILLQTDISPLMRDEISLAENRNKLVIPIYYQSVIPLDKAMTYSFANSSQILFTQDGFSQLLLSIKLQFKLLKEQATLLNIKTRLNELNLLNKS